MHESRKPPLELGGTLICEEGISDYASAIPNLGKVVS